MFSFWLTFVGKEAEVPYPVQVRQERTTHRQANSSHPTILR